MSFISYCNPLVYRKVPVQLVNFIRKWYRLPAIIPSCSNDHWVDKEARSYRFEENKGRPIAGEQPSGFLFLTMTSPVDCDHGIAHGLSRGGQSGIGHLHVARRARQMQKQWNKRAIAFVCFLLLELVLILDRSYLDTSPETLAYLLATCIYVALCQALILTRYSAQNYQSAEAYRNTVYQPML